MSLIKKLFVKNFYKSRISIKIKETIIKTFVSLKNIKILFKFFNLYSSDILITRIEKKNSIGIINIPIRIYINIKEYQKIKISEAYLRVDKDTLWITPEIYEKLMIMSNTYWTIT